MAKRLKNYFFPFFYPSLHPLGAPQGCPSGPGHAIGAAQGGPDRGVSRDGVSQAIPGNDLHLLQRGRAGLGDRSQSRQSQIPVLTLRPLLPQLPPAWVRWVTQGTHRTVLPEVGMYPKVFLISCLQVGVAQKWPEPCPPPENWQ